MPLTFRQGGNSDACELHGAMLSLATETAIANRRNLVRLGRTLTARRESRIGQSLTTRGSRLSGGDSGSPESEIPPEETRSELLRRHAALEANDGGK